MPGHPLAAPDGPSSHSSSSSSPAGALSKPIKSDSSGLRSTPQSATSSRRTPPNASSSTYKASSRSAEETRPLGSPSPIGRRVSPSSSDQPSSNLSSSRSQPREASQTASSSSSSSSPSYSPLSQVRNSRASSHSNSRQAPPLSAAALGDVRPSARSGAPLGPIASSSNSGDPHRSHSVRSQLSEGANTDGGYSSSGRDSLRTASISRRTSRSGRAALLTKDGGESTISSLGRSGSSASTVPTSPGLEPLPPVPPAKLAMNDDAHSIVAQVAEVPTTTPPELEDMEHPYAIRRSRSRTLTEEPLPLATQGAALPTIYSVGDVIHKEAEPVGYNDRQMSQTSRWNKPLPSPGSQGTDRTPSERGESDGASAGLGGRPPSRSALRSAISQGTKYLRRSSAGTKKTSMSEDQEGRQLAHTRAASFNGGQAPTELKFAPPARSHSPFLFRRKSKSNLAAAAAGGPSAPPLPDLKASPIRAGFPVSQSGRRPSDDPSLSVTTASPSREGPAAPLSPLSSLSARQSGDWVASPVRDEAYLHEESGHRKPASLSRAVDKSPRASPSSRPSFLHSRSSTMSELQSLSEGGEGPEAARESWAYGSSSENGAPALSGLSPALSVSMRPRQSRWSRVMGKSDHGASMPSHESSPRLSLAVPDKQSYSGSPRSQLPQGRSGAEVRSPNSTRSGSDTTSILRRSPIPSIASSTGSRQTTTIRKGTKQSSAEGITASTGWDASSDHFGAKRTSETPEVHTALSDREETRASTPLSPATIGMWSSAVASELDLTEQRKSDERDSRQGRDGGEPERLEALSDPNSEDMSQYHDALSSPDSGELTSSRRGSATKRSEARGLTVVPIGGATQTPSKSRSTTSSLGRTLSTIFDPRPSLQGRIPTSSGPPGMYVQPKMDSGRGRSSTQSSSQESTASTTSTRRSGSTQDNGTSMGPPLHPSTARKALNGGASAGSSSNAKGASAGERRSPTRERRPSAGSARMVGLSKADSAKRSTDTTQIVTGHQEAVASRQRAAEIAKQRAQGGPTPLPPPKAPASITKAPQPAGASNGSTTAVGAQSNTSALGRLRKRSLTSLSAVRAGAAASSTAKTLTASENGTDSRLTSEVAFPTAAGPSRVATTGEPVKSKATPPSTSTASAKKMIRSASAMDASDASKGRWDESAGRQRLTKSRHSQQMKEMNDRDFMNLLETARREHKENAANNIQSASKAISKPPTPAKSADRTTSTGAKAELGPPRPTLHRRTSSADGRLGGDFPSNDGNGVQALNVEIEPKEQQEAPTPSPLGSAVRLFEVGHASGKTTDVFTNDEEWKREVRALFVIRELLNTEQSYARHLETLLAAVRRKATATSTSPAASHSRRKSSTSLLGADLTMSASSALVSRTSSSVASDRHLPLMRNLLPQLIALSRSLAARIDANPTAAGVGSAFLSIARQLEATFVAWSMAAQDIMKSLSITQGPKGKPKDRLFLDPAIDTDSSVFKVSAAEGISETSGDAAVNNGLGITGRPNTPPGRHARSISYSSPSSPASQALKYRGRSFSAEQTLHAPVGRRSKPESSMSTVGEVGLASSPTEIEDNPFLEESPEPAPANVQPPSRPVSPWGFAASTKRSLAAVKRKQSSDTITGGGWLSRRQSFSTDAASIGALSRGGSRSGTSTPFQPLAPSTSPEQPSSVVGSASGISTGGGGGGGYGGSTVRALSALDVAIMPMQRPPRYLLLLADLVKHTAPDSESHAVVARSLEVMKIIAKKCDEASPTR
ncbi:hypothetical protein BCV69DRAFT_291716 [Microstroma glucosiphilum]|uniref:DH domain-containing protein n=1 Tax=Pseudomicrostroma glucosiphilum TaxID=1684307 RepID=A0A316UFJ0_9BASI|nr:hypothetical protein BCV69DRAFT_291716 [Pseudomicrostroma glucosiphilum]PWN23698.1 hypothetical protein BCV69DRAFT_291716 [Pseudomicrostroma glucosiphilum]